MKTPNTFSVHEWLIKFTGSLFAGLLLLSVIIACRSSSSSENASCTGAVTYEGKTYTGGGKNTNGDDAQRFACNNYCLNADPEFDAHYGIWLESPKGEAAGRPSKKEAIYKDKDLMNYLTNDCATKCVASVKAGKLKGTTTCP